MNWIGSVVQCPYLKQANEWVAISWKWLILRDGICFPHEMVIDVFWGSRSSVVVGSHELSVCCT